MTYCRGLPLGKNPLKVKVLILEFLTTFSNVMFLSLTRISDIDGGFPLKKSFYFRNRFTSLWRLQTLGNYLLYIYIGH